MEQQVNKSFWKSKKFLYGLGIFFALGIVVDIFDGSPVPAVQQTTTQPIHKTEQVVVENKKPAPVVAKVTTNTSLTTAKTETKTDIATTQAPAPAPQTERDSVLVILKANASTKWGTDYKMVQFEYNNQVLAYDWVVVQTKYPAIMTNAKNKWGNDYQMVKFEYSNQVEAYEWIMAQTAYPNIMTSAKQKWGDDYQMVKYEYNNQVEAYKSL